MSVFIRSEVRVCNADRELSAAVDGVGIFSDSAKSRGRSSSIVSGSGGMTRGDNRGNVRFCSCLVWWERCVVRAECAVMSLSNESVRTPVIVVEGGLRH